MTHTPEIHYIAIAAMARNRIIGNSGKIPWYIPDDFKHFKSTTEWHPIIMGRKTFDSIGRVLPGRENIVLTRGDFTFPGVTVMHSVEELGRYLSEKYGDNPSILSGWGEQNPPAFQASPLHRGVVAFICGGSQIYEEFFQNRKTDEVILSVVDMEPEGDAAFPYFEESFTKVREDRRDGFTIEHWKRWHIPHQNPHI